MGALQHRAMRHHFDTEAPPDHAIPTLAHVKWMDRPDPDAAAHLADQQFDEAMREGAGAWRRLRGSCSWTDWKIVFVALAAVRDKARKTSGARRGHDFNLASGKLLAESGLDEIPPPTHAMRSPAMTIWQKSNNGAPDYRSSDNGISTTRKASGAPSGRRNLERRGHQARTARPSHARQPSRCRLCCSASSPMSASAIRPVYAPTTCR
jgi:hypothetical protein